MNFFSALTGSRCSTLCATVLVVVIIVDVILSCAFAVLAVHLLTLFCLDDCLSASPFYRVQAMLVDFVLIEPGPSRRLNSYAPPAWYLPRTTVLVAFEWVLVAFEWKPRRQPPAASVRPPCARVRVRAQLWVCGRGGAGGQAAVRARLCLCARACA